LRVLVTGGAGFLGSHIVDALLARGDDVMVVDDLSTGDRANLDRKADFSVADIADLSALQRGIGSRRIDAVVHCAAKTKVVESMTKKDLYERVIVGGTRNVVQTSRRLGASIFVNISTGGAIYGETPVCADETVAVDPQSNYGRFKAKAEKLVESSDLRAVTLRLANIYNIGTGVATSVKELVSALTSVLGPPAGVHAAPARPGEVLRGCVDPGKAAHEGLWRPKTALVEGLRLTAAAEGVLLS